MIPLDTKNIDKQYHPGDDFFRFVNGNWLKNNPIPDDKTRYGAFDEVIDKNNRDLKHLFQEIEKDKTAQAGTNKQKIRDFYTSGMENTCPRDELINVFRQFYFSAFSYDLKEELVKTIAFFQLSDIAPLFEIYAGQDAKNTEMMIANFWQGGLGLPNRDYYFEKGERFEMIRKEYKKHIATILKFTGFEENFVSKHAEHIYKIEEELAEASFTPLECRDPNKTYNKMSIEDLQKTAPGFDWRLFFDEIGMQNVNEVNIAQVKFAQKIGALIERRPADDWRIFLTWKLYNATANYLSKDFVNEHFNFYSKILSGSKKIKPLWERTLTNVSSLLGEAVGQLYVEKHFPPQAKERMLKLVGYLKTALRQRIENLSWMTRETKQKALTKLETMNVKIGYPDEWKDYSELTISNKSYIQNIIEAWRFLIKDNFRKVGKPVNKKEWYMPPQTVNAYYSPLKNEIVFPAAILQPPFFNLEADDPINYGAIGMVIGHEMTHAFDDQGRNFDEKGNLTDWWTKDDQEEFKKRTQILVKQYNDYKVIDNQTINGELTLGENIADLGGLVIALEALKKAQKENQYQTIDNFTPIQRFFMSYAQVWRQNIRPETLLRRIKEDVHSPAEYRVNGALANVPEFYEHFDITETNKLFISPDKRPVIW